MADKKWEDLSAKEELAVVWVARKYPEIRSVLDDTLRQVDNLQSLCGAYEQSMDGRKEWQKRKKEFAKDPEWRATRRALGLSGGEEPSEGIGKR